MNEKVEMLKQQALTQKISLVRNFLIILIVLAILFLVVSLIMTPRINLNGENEIILKYPEKYIEPGYVATKINKDITSKVKISGKVDQNKLGTYKLTYGVNNFIFKTKVIRTVRVIDDEKPKIILNGGESTKVCPNTEYKELGFEVTDNFDKNLKEMTKIITNEDEVIYAVKDTAGNKTKAIRKLFYRDDTKPEIKLEGFNPSYLFVGSKYKEAGYSSLDNCDGNLTEKVKINGTVNTNLPGKYYLTYNVKDLSGNETIVKREIIVERPKQTGSSCNTPGVIYLTFDDGPRDTTTAQVLNILKEEKVKATFFVTNSGPDKLIKRIYDEGHSIGLHTASHNYSVVYASVDSYFNDLSIVSNRVKNITGYESKIIRFPGGSSNLVSKKYAPGIMTTLTTEVVNRGYKYYDWNVSSEDAGICANIRTGECVYENTIKNLSKNKCNMVLMHDIKQYTVNALREIIKYGKQEGYTFKKIDNNTPMVRQRINN